MAKSKAVVSLMCQWSQYSLVLIHLSLDKMAVILQTTFPNIFSWMKNFVFWFEFHWSLFLWVQLTISQHWFRWCCLVYWCIYVSLGLNELSHLSNKKNCFHCVTCFNTNVANSISWSQTIWTIYIVHSIPWLLMAWRHKEPGHQKPWYWLSYPGTFQIQHQKS